MQITPRPFQQQLHDCAARFMVAVIHRRAGKTVFAVDWLLEPALDPDFPHSPPYRGYYVAPYRQQAAEVSLDYFLQFIPKGVKHSTNKNALTIDFPDTGARIQMLGTEWNLDRHRGKYADRVVFDETAQIAPSAWREVFRPMLSDRNGRALFIGTVAGKNHFHDLFQLGRKGVKDWASFLLRADETGILSSDELEQLRAEMGEREYRREMLCDWNAGAPGAYFEEAMNVAEDEGRITGVPLDAEREVYASWWFSPEAVTVTLLQQKETRFHALRSKRFLQQSLPEVVQWLEGLKGHVVKSHYAGGNRITKDDERTKILRRLGVKLRCVDTALTHDSLVQLLKVRLRSIYFDTQAADDLVEGLRMAHAPVDQDKRTVSDQPVRDWAYDESASLFPFCILHSGRRTDWSKPINYQGRAA